jgi:hypothetical protein
VRYLFIFCFLFSNLALANTGASLAIGFGVFGLVWVFFIIPIEGKIYKKLNIESPYKFATGLNIVSTLIGIPSIFLLQHAGWVESPRWIELHYLRTPLEEKLTRLEGFSNAYQGHLIVISYYFVTSFVSEYLVALGWERFRKRNIKFVQVLKANAVTYGIAFVWVMFSASLPMYNKAQELKENHQQGLIPPDYDIETFYKNMQQYRKDYREMIDSANNNNSKAR